MRIHVIAFTDRGFALSCRTASCLSNHVVKLYGKKEGFVQYESVQAFAENAFRQADAIVFIGAAGIAVRAIAPYVKKKETDPAVLVMDENGAFVISLLSGHIGGANRLTEQLSAALHAIPVITTATDGRGIFAADAWASEHHCVVADTQKIKLISGALLRGETIGFYSDYPIYGSLPEHIVEDTAKEYGIVVSIEREKNIFKYSLQLIPKIIHVGIGCKRNTPPEKLEQWFQDVLFFMNIHGKAIASISSIDLKKEEAAILRLAKKWNIPANFYTAQELENVEGSFPSSAFVRSITGTDNVCQRSAAKASHDGICLLEKTSRDGMTISIYCENWRVKF